jgi:hypothetical protein
MTHEGLLLALCDYTALETKQITYPILKIANYENT